MRPPTGGWPMGPGAGIARLRTFFHPPARPSAPRWASVCLMPLAPLAPGPLGEADMVPHKSLDNVREAVQQFDDHNDENVRTNVDVSPA